MIHINNNLIYNDIENNSIVIGFIKDDEKVINESLRNILFDDSEAYSKFLSSNKPSIFNKYIKLENINRNIIYYIFLESNEKKLDKYNQFVKLMFIDVCEFYNNKNIENIYTYINFLDDNKKNIFIDILKYFDDKLNVKIYNNNIT